MDTSTTSSGTGDTATKSASKDGRGARRGAIGERTYKDVRRLIDAGMTRTAAFEKVAKDTGRSAATVATTFYRIARQQPDGGGVRRTATRGAKSARKATTVQAERLAGDARQAVDAMQRHIADLEQQVADLTEQLRQYDKIKRVLDRM
jgi:cell division septum initiation protein DivIVA